MSQKVLTHNVTSDNIYLQQGNNDSKKGRKDGEKVLDAKEIGERLIKLRGSLTRERVAKAIGISVSAVSMYENGERIPRDAIKIRLANFYGKSVQEIFFD